MTSTAHRVVNTVHKRRHEPGLALASDSALKILLANHGIEQRFSNFFFKWGPLIFKSQQFRGPPYSRSL